MKRYNNDCILVIPDIHAPYHHPDTIIFLEAVAITYSPDRIIQIGDISDQYCFSRYPKDIENPLSYTTEYRGVRKLVRELTDLFPEGIAIKGNHDARLWERAKVAGIPRGMITPYEEAIGLSETGWKMHWDYSVTISADRSSWYFVHTKSGGPLSLAGKYGMSVVMGHEHNKFAVNTLQTPMRRLYGVHAGCLIGSDRYAFAYNKQSAGKPNRGCVVIIKGVPKLIPMELTPTGRWNRKVA